MRKNAIGEYIRVGDCDAYVEIMGEGRPLMFFAPAGRDNMHWRDSLRHFSDRYTCIAVDLPGRGKSTIYSRDLPYLLTDKQMCDFHYEILKALGFDEVAVCGTSMGGTLCYSMAAYYPDLVKVSVPVQGSINRPLMRRPALEYLIHPHNNIMHGMADNMGSLIGRRCTDEGREFLEDTLPYTNPRALHADLVAFVETDLSDVQHQIKAPTLAIAGTDDWLMNKEVLEKTIADMPEGLDITYHPLDQLGHFVHLERPDEFFGAVDPFLATHYPAGG
ncbi:alpha/beta fold hydrolase [Ruegeria jejuensis]|uniref:alpha/beta fold hydrolase n=1 Tax=Ruegeria jejuensis TaxID=3233338 RepID=UPI00355B46B8